jgi:hypothetical protein
MSMMGFTGTARSRSAVIIRLAVSGSSDHLRPLTFGIIFPWRTEKTTGSSQPMK